MAKRRIKMKKCISSERSLVHDIGDCDDVNKDDRDLGHNHDRDRVYHTMPMMMTMMMPTVIMMVMMMMTMLMITIALSERCLRMS